MRLLNIGELRKDSIGALTFGAEIPPYKDGMLPCSPRLRHAFPTAPTWQVLLCQFHLLLLHPRQLKTAYHCSFKRVDAEDLMA